MSSKADLFTLAIPTWNRVSLLKRLLAYLAESGFQYRILILDSSNDEFRAQVKEVADEFLDRLNISLLNYDGSLLAMRKMELCLSEVRTPFAGFCADDDFYQVDAVDRIVEFLSGNAEYIAAQGQEVVFATEGGKFNATVRRSQPDVEMDDVAERLYRHLSNYRQTFYAIHQTEELVRCFEDNLTLFPDDLRWTEIYPSCRTIIKGKVKRFDFVQEVRQSHGGQAHNKLLSHGDWMLSEPFRGDHQKFNESLARDLVEYGGLAVSEAKEATKRAFLSYLSTYIGVSETPHGWYLPYDRESLNEEDWSLIGRIKGFALGEEKSE